MTPLEPGGIFSRLFAWIVDRLVLAAVWALVACWGFVAFLGWTRWPLDLVDLAALLGLLLLWWIVLHAAYSIVFVGGCGQTPGKMLLGLAVVSRDGAVPGYGRALLRWIGSVLSALPFGLGFAPALFGGERRGLHDLIAGTRVVRRWGAPESAPALAAPQEVTDGPTGVSQA